MQQASHGGAVRYPNLAWAISQWGPRYKLAASIGRSESWLSRRLSGWVEFSAADRDRVADTLDYPSDWLFQEATPPVRAAARAVSMTSGW